MMDGYGRLITSNGDVHVGLFKKHLKHGEGEYTKADGKVVYAVWSKGKQHRDGEMVVNISDLGELDMKCNDTSGENAAEWKKLQTKLVNHIAGQRRSMSVNRRDMAFGRKKSPFINTYDSSTALGVNLSKVNISKVNPSKDEQEALPLKK